MTEPVVRALIFDFDGVLADTEDLHCAAFQAVAGEVGLSLTRDRYYREFLGLPDRECLAALHAHAGRTLAAGQLDDLVARKRTGFAALAGTAQLYPGVAEMLHRLHQRAVLAVASGAFRDEIEPILDRAGVRQLFSVIIGAEDVRAGKPAPDPFLAALRAINEHVRPAVSVGECLVIEDSPLGISAARAAGMRCVAVATNHDRATLVAADAVIDHASQLRLEEFGVGDI